MPVFNNSLEYVDLPSAGADQNFMREIEIADEVLFVDPSATSF